MIISQTPLRISLLGGGTDFRRFYLEHGGAVLSLGIDKYIYVIVKGRYDDAICLNYSHREVVLSTDEIQHALIREAMRKTGILRGVEITTLADIPSEGTGLGSSSSVTVGLLNAMYAYQGMQVPAERLAQEACEIEIDLLHKPIGVQDQTIAAHGNLCFVEFQKDNHVSVQKVDMTPDAKRVLVSNLLLFYTNRTRKADVILKEQESNIPDRTPELCRLRDLAYEGHAVLLDGDFDRMGSLLHESWLLKRRLASAISDPQIEDMYATARAAGATGGKVTGAGGGGFILLYCPREKQNAVRKALLGDYRELPFMLSRDGSRIVFNIGS
jgi:D-glycero-alpha-D-manno-heptose-7-phosphate kinase